MKKKQLSPNKLQETIQSLSESGWIFSSLIVLSETGALALLKNETKLDDLKTILYLPEEILKQMIGLLTKSGFLIENSSAYHWSAELAELINSATLDTFIAQIRFISRMTKEFTQAASSKTLKPDWYQVDEVILHSWGKLSQFFGNNLISEDPRLVQLLKNPDALFLDAGAGTASISVQLCQIYPDLKIVAIDCTDKPLALAKKNIEQHNLSNRIKLRKTFLQDINDKDLYDVVWFPQVFYSKEEFSKCLKVIFKALKPSGMIYAAALSSNETDISSLILQLNNATYGSLRYVDDVTEGFKNAGFSEIKIFGESNGYKSFNGYSLITAMKI